jgi:hypothetical protein
MCGCHCRYALRANEYASFPTAGLRQPLLVHGVGGPKNNDIRGAQTHVSKSGGRQPAVGTVSSRGWRTVIHRQAGRAHQERRASARRANETNLQWREFFPERVRSRTTGGLRPPLLAACADVIADIRFAPTSTLLFPRLTYAPRSWLHVRMSLQIRASRQRVRIFSHGWLTSAALGGWRWDDSQNRRL